MPTIKSNIKAEFVLEEARFFNTLNCFEVGKQLYAVQDSVCSKAQAGLDSLWLSYGIIILGACISMFLVPFVMQRLFQVRVRVDPEVFEDGGDGKMSILKSSKEDIHIARTVQAEDE